jgi:hypothetical protein
MWSELTPSGLQEALSLVPSPPPTSRFFFVLAHLCTAPSHLLLPTQISAGLQDRATAKGASVLNSPR